MTYDEAIYYIEHASTFGIQLGLGRIEELLRRLGNPQTTYKTIHVTGTNGKGSVSAMISQALCAAGIRTGRYTSPHLEEYTERMNIDGCDISCHAFAEAIAVIKLQVEAMAADGMERPTEFEMLTAAAFWYFSKEKVEYAVIEVGLGGLLDSTNVIVPVVSVVTNVALDHLKYCGPTILDVAAHKAGIFKRGVPVVTAACEPALQVLCNKAADLQCPLILEDREYGVRNRNNRGVDGQCFVVWRKGKADLPIHMPLLGAHQAQNGAVAVMALTTAAEQDDRITDEAVCRGLAQVQWPGRFQILQKEERTILIDGAHNPAGIDTFCQTYKETFGDRKRVFLFSVLADKDYTTMVKKLFHSEDRVVCAPAPTPRTADPQAMAEMLPCSAIGTATLEEGLDKAALLIQPGQILCIVGSLYIQGDVRRYLRQHGWMTKAK